MPFLYHDLYSVFLLIIICLFSILCVARKKQIQHLIFIPFDQHKNYESLYFERNINFSFIRFLYFLIIILTTTCLVSLLFDNVTTISFVLLFLKLICFFLIKYFGIILFGLIRNKYQLFKKITIINIDSKAFIAIYFFPILTFISYSNFFNNKALFLISSVFIVILIITKFVFLYKSKSIIKYSFIDIISYLCFLELGPIILFYNLI